MGILACVSMNKSPIYFVGVSGEVKYSSTPLYEFEIQDLLKIRTHTENRTIKRTLHISG